MYVCMYVYIYMCVYASTRPPLFPQHGSVHHMDLYRLSEEKKQDLGILGFPQVLQECTYYVYA